MTRLPLFGLPLLVGATLACQAATRLVIPATPTLLPTSTGTPTLAPTLTPTLIFEAACPPLMADILSTDSSEVILETDPADSDSSEKERISLVTYTVVRESLNEPRTDPVPEDLLDERDDRPRHEAIWNYFASLIPPQDREQISEFAIFTDGPENHLAFVRPAFPDPHRWTLEVDILDAESYYDLTYTLIHEEGHLLTLNADQVPPSDAIFSMPGNEDLYGQQASSCQQYFTGEGCSQPDSYINQFFDRFWPYLYDEWQGIVREEDETTRAALLEDFYRVHEDQFVSEYASTSPMEDIAESWTFFVLSPRPELSSIASEKILFFYEYPELVSLRREILVRLCAEFPR